MNNRGEKVGFAGDITTVAGVQIHLARPSTKLLNNQKQQAYVLPSKSEGAIRSIPLIRS